MKRLGIILLTLFGLLSVQTEAQTIYGYAIYGDVPYEYEDLRSNIEVSIPAVVSGQDIQGSSVYSTPVDQDGLAWTGQGLSGSHACQNYASLSIRFASDQTMTLTDKMVIHIKMKRTDDNTSGLVRLSMMHTTWGSRRLSFQIDNTNITTTATDFECAYSNPLTNFGYSTYGQDGMKGTNVSYPGGAGKELFRFEGANGEAFEITQIYIDADATSPDPVAPVAGDTDAPESLTLAASNILDKTVTLTASATDENSPISYTFYYKAAGDADFTEVAGAVAAASGADAVKVVSGLAPETNYSFKVIATDPSANPAETTISGIETLAAFKNRFYFFRAGDIPEIEGVNMVDLREGVGTTFQLNNMTKTSNVDYIHYALNGSWFSFNQNLSASTDMSIVEQSTWYLCIKMRTNLNQTSYNLRLNNAGECWMISSSNLPLECDGSWETLALPLSTSSKTLTFTASMTGTIFQMHANGSSASDYIDIEYAYLTDDASMDEKPAIVDNDAPTNFSVTEKDGATTYNSATLQLYAEDEDTPITYTINYVIKNSGDTPTETYVNGAQSTTVEKTITGLSPETTYTFSVVASDPNSNETEPEVIEITTEGFMATRYYLMRGNNTDPLPSSATLTSTLVNCNVSYGNNASRDNRTADYLSVTMPNNWTAIAFNPTATVDNMIDDDWYIVVRMRTTLSTSFDFDRFRLNLVNNGQNWYINNSDGDKPFGRDYNDGNWIVIKKKIGERRGGTNVPSTYLAASQIAAQVHIDNSLVAGERIDIDYIYFTNDISDIDPGTQFGKRIAITESDDNSSVLTANNGQTVEVDLTRSLTSESYNTFCVPFGMNAEQVETVFGAGAKIGKLNTARIKESDELYLGFAFVSEIEAGVPYIIQPANDVANPLISNVLIDNTASPTAIEDVVTFQGVINPTAIDAQSAESHTILLLGANNTLSWPNTSANIKGIRAYFETEAGVAPVARRARLGFDAEEVVTDVETADCQRSTANARKVLRDGQLLIIRDNEMYNMFGNRVQ